ncbi:MAG: DUF4089 domain-containing protein [Rhodospirillales bacterium]|nr:DUF4089 domain-containing protein [Rhodospirillales bacterium]
MTDDERLDHLIAAGTETLGLHVQPEWLPAIRLHLGISLRHAATVLGAPLPDEADPAPVFVA